MTREPERKREGERERRREGEEERRRERVKTVGREVKLEGEFCS